MTVEKDIDYTNYFLQDEMKGRIKQGSVVWVAQSNLSTLRKPESEEYLILTSNVLRREEGSLASNSMEANVSLSNLAAIIVSPSRTVCTTTQFTGNRAVSFRTID